MTGHVAISVVGIVAFFSWVICCRFIDANKKVHPDAKPFHMFIALWVVASIATVLYDAVLREWLCSI